MIRLKSCWRTCVPAPFGPKIDLDVVELDILRVVRRGVAGRTVVGTMVGFWIALLSIVNQYTDNLN